MDREVGMVFALFVVNLQNTFAKLPELLFVVWTARKNISNWLKLSTNIIFSQLIYGNQFMCVSEICSFFWRTIKIQQLSEF